MSPGCDRARVVMCRCDVAPRPLPREWIELMRMVRGMSERKIRSLMDSEVDPRNALGTIDLVEIEAVQAINNPKKLVSCDCHVTCCVHT